MKITVSLLLKFSIYEQIFFVDMFDLTLFPVFYLSMGYNLHKEVKRIRRMTCFDIRSELESWEKTY